MEKETWKEVSKDPRQWHEYCNPGWENRFCRLKNGIKISYCVMGPENGLPIFLCHGNTDCRISWSHVAPILAHVGFRVYVPEQRGHGLSEGPVVEKGYYDFKEDLMEDVVELMDHLGVEKASFVGHSGGSFMLQMLGIYHPERVKSLTLISTACEFPYRRDYEYQGEDLVGDKDFLLMLAEAGLDDKEFQAGIAKHLVENMTNHIMAYVRTEFSHPQNFDTSELLAKVTCPVQIFWGTADPLFDAETEKKTLAALKNAPVDFIPVEGGGHSFFWDSWENIQMLANSIADFARKANK